MNYDVIKTAVLIPDLIFEGKDEIPIDFDFTLPDYCPDIGRILKCQITPLVLSRNILGDKLSVEGNIRLELLYLELDSSVLRCYKTETPFADTIDLRSVPNSGVALIDPNLEYINCRAVSPRRIDIHGAFTLRTKVYSKKSVEISKEIVNDDAEQLKKDLKFSDLSTLTQQITSVSEILDLGSEKPPIESIIRADASVFINDFKCFTGKVNVKGEIRIKILYLSDLETGKLENIDYEIPFNQDIEALESTDDSKCIIRASIINHEEKISGDSNSDNISNLINIDLKMLFTVFCFEKRNEKILVDAYSINYNLESIFNDTNLIKFENSIQDQFSHKTSIEIPENKILKLVDVWASDIKVILKNDNNNLIYGCKIQISMIALNTDSIPFYTDKTIDFTKEVSANFNDDILQNKFQNICSAKVNSIGYKIAGDQKLDFKFDVIVNTEVFSNHEITFINEAKVDETKPKEKDPSTAIIVYYGKPGESVWDISKRYSTTMNKIKEENEIESDVLDDEKAILVPIS